jgi:hypothetical protein
MVPLVERLEAEIVAGGSAGAGVSEEDFAAFTQQAEGCGDFMGFHVGSAGDCSIHWSEGHLPNRDEGLVFARVGLTCFVCLFIPFNVLYESKTIVGRLSRLSLD